MPVVNFVTLSSEAASESAVIAPVAILTLVKALAAIAPALMALSAMCVASIVSVANLQADNIDAARVEFSIAFAANLDAVNTLAANVSATIAPLPNLVLVRVDAAIAPALMALSAMATASIASVWNVLAVMALAVRARVVKFQISVVVGAVAPGIEPNGRITNPESDAGVMTKLSFAVATLVEAKSEMTLDWPLPVPDTIISMVSLKKHAEQGLSARNVIPPADAVQAVPL